MCEKLFRMKPTGRRLRLHFKHGVPTTAYPTFFNYDVGAAKLSCAPRMQYFGKAMTLFSAETRDAILSANERLQQMGYSFQEPFYLYETNESVFDRWDVMKRKDI